MAAAHNRRTYSELEKNLIMQQVKSGVTTAEISRIYGVPSSTVSTWMAENCRPLILENIVPIADVTKEMVHENTVKPKTIKPPTATTSRRKKLPAVKPKHTIKPYDGKIEKNEFEVFGNHIAKQLKQLSTTEFIYAQQEIQNILTNSRLNDLKRAQPNNQDLSNISSSSRHPI